MVFSAGANFARLVGVITRAESVISACPMTGGRELEPDWVDGVHTTGRGNPRP
jgi:hypothetical protein